ncbi:MAG TPA: hypothetical protein VER03_24980 [Bryobacteraceae bacterium]|nr:hypothetical protein [Bryobacteraceae bacterium]
MKKCLLMIVAAVSLFAESRLDKTVVGEFFAGLRGDNDAMARAMKTTETILATNPKHAEALVWHGIGLLSQSRQSPELFARAQKEMEEAGQLEPDNIGVRIPRGATYMGAGRQFAERSPEMGRAWIAKGLADYQHVYEMRRNHLATMGEHPAGELLLGIADANSRLGNMDRAAEFFDRITTQLPNSEYAKRAALWKETKSLSAAQAGCIGCHVATVK